MAEGKQIYAALQAVQRELKAPKGQFNSFGKYKYRSCEDIVEAVKPLLNDNGLILTMSDDVVEIGNYSYKKDSDETVEIHSRRVYIKATATVIDVVTGDKIDVSALAREPEEKKGMDSSQVTGTASSYARKYALNGLFAIDDTKDADTNEYASQNKAGATKQTQTTHNKANVPQTPQQANDAVRQQAINKALQEIKRLNVPQDIVCEIAYQHFKANGWADMTDNQIVQFTENLEKWAKAL